MSTPAAFDPWAVLARIRGGKPDFRNFRNFRNGTPQNANPAAAPQWTADDWGECFEERLAVAMIDGEQPEPEARQIAWECCIIRWLDLHPVRSAPDHCAQCGRTDLPGNILPFGAEPIGHAWLHPGCWERWHARRLAEATAALSPLGIAPDREPAT